MPCSAQKMKFATLLSRDEEYSKFVVDQKLWRKEVADAPRFAEGTSRFVQAQKTSADGHITLEVEGDADRFACEILYLKFRGFRQKDCARQGHQGRMEGGL